MNLTLGLPMSKGKKQLLRYVVMLDQRSLRERIYILLALIILLGVGWNQLFLEPSIAARGKNLTEMTRVNDEMVLLHAAEAVVVQQATIDPDQEVRQQIAQLDQAINDLDRKLEARLIDLVSPQRMPVLLQKLLKKQKALHLIKMENLPPEQMMTSLDGEKATPLGIYIHALNMELEGSYLKLLTYLQALEQMEQRVFWDILTIETEGLPVARIRLQIHTLSLTEDWIGV